MNNYNDDVEENPDSEWRPPTDAERKVLEARRERSDKISKLMSQYLLKGHKMLATTCQVCDTIELEDKQGNVHCIACSEIDNHEVSKDDPALNQRAASKTLAESSQRAENSNSTESDSKPAAVTVNDSMEVVLQKLRKATQALAVTENVELSRDYVVLIKECADAIIALRKAET